MGGKGGHRDKMRDECVRMHTTLIERKSIRIEDLADVTGISLRTTYRWIGSFSLVMPVTLRNGVVFFGDEIF